MAKKQGKNGDKFALFFCSKFAKIGY